MVATMMTTGTASADSCDPGWYVIGEYETSFYWQEQFLPFRSVTWTGTAELLERKDSGCYVAEIQLGYTGPASGGTLILNGDLFVSYTVQYPDPFDSSGAVADNAYGDLVSWNPPEGWNPGYSVEPQFDINARGADEYVIWGQGIPALIPQVQAAFNLPLELLGQTVYAQIHVGTDLCRCSATAISLPGESAPSPPPPPPPPAPTEMWDVYVHAHQDDWQLFLSPNAYYDYQHGDHLLFVYATAGDAGLGPGWWQPREEGAKASVREIAGSGQAEGTLSGIFCHSAPADVCHTISGWTYGNSVSIFMRLPDGNVGGTGFPTTGNQSLALLRDGGISSMTAVDGSTTYDSWADFYLTVNAIIMTYTPYDSTTWVNAPDFDRVRQTSQGDACHDCPDHADHLAVADAVHTIAVDMGAPWSRAWFIDYPIGYADPRYPANLGPTDYLIKKQAFMAYNDVVFANTGSNEYTARPDFWENCFQRTYYVLV